jgi:glutamyl-tRNA synthetase
VTVLSTAPVRVRFAPSPTGSLHLGSARVALYNWLVARSLGGTMLLRIEDTDPERSTPENIEEIYRMLDWLGLSADEEPVLQTARAERHRELLDRLLAEGKVYRTEARKTEVDAWKANRDPGTGYRGTDEGVGAYRLALPTDGTISFTDLIRGETTFSFRTLDDPVIARADGSALYNFAVAIDDADMAITHVIRGEDHISNTPTQMLVLEALGYAIPTYAHLPLILGPDKKKLSKRHKTADGAPLAVTVEALKADGYLPEAILSYLSRLGWGTAEDGVLSVDQMVAQFRLEDVNSHGARYDLVKLRDTNGQFIRGALDYPFERYLHHLSEFLRRPVDETLRAAALAVQEKAGTLAEATDLLSYLWAEPAYLHAENPVFNEKAWKKFMQAPALQTLPSAHAFLSGCAWDVASIHDGLLAQAAEHGCGPGKYFQPIRIALTGGTVSAGIGETIWLLGREESLRRIEACRRVLARRISDAHSRELDKLGAPLE